MMEASIYVCFRENDYARLIEWLTKIWADILNFHNVLELDVRGLGAGGLSEGL